MECLPANLLTIYSEPELGPIRVMNLDQWSAFDLEDTSRIEGECKKIEEAADSLPIEYGRMPKPIFRASVVRYERSYCLETRVSLPKESLVPIGEFCSEDYAHAADLTTISKSPMQSELPMLSGDAPDSMSKNFLKGKCKQLIPIFGHKDTENIYAIYCEVFNRLLTSEDDKINQFFNREVISVLIYHPYLFGAPFEAWSQNLNIETSLNLRRR